MLAYAASPLNVATQYIHVELLIVTIAVITLVSMNSKNSIKRQHQNSFISNERHILRDEKKGLTM